MIYSISGKLRSGKDLSGKIIQYLKSDKDVRLETSILDWIQENVCRECVSLFEIKKFADKLKDMVCLLINCTRDQLEDQEFKNTELGEEWWYWVETSSWNYSYKKLYAYIDYPNPPSFPHCTLYKHTPRTLLQLLGTEASRTTIHPNIWINSLMSEYKEAPQNVLKNEGYHLEDIYPSWCITDMRFLNEMKAVKDKGGITIRINRPIHLRFPEFWIDFLSSQPSKTEESDFLEWLQNHKEKTHQELYITLTHKSETDLDSETFDYVINNDGEIEALVEQIKQCIK